MLLHLNNALLGQINKKIGLNYITDMKLEACIMNRVDKCGFPNIAFGK